MLWFCLKDIIRTRGRIFFSKLAYICHLNKLQEPFRFGDLDPIFKVIRRLKYVIISGKNVCLLNVKLDTHQTCMVIYFEQSEDLRFGDLDPIIKVNSQITGVKFP